MKNKIITLAGLTGVLLLKEKDWPELKKRIYPGDVICVERWGSLYRHYGVYVGNKKLFIMQARLVTGIMTLLYGK